ncbi:Cell division cycle 20.1, cofactor of APC complex [Glycine max]|nr:Cell division cycle 20.1, cofactor of APC complex [Glycine max]
MDWGENNILAATNNKFPTSVSWSEDTNYLAIGYMNSELQLWDAETSKPIRILQVRATNNVISWVKAHKAEVCGLKWTRGNILASGGNENHVYVWDLAKRSSSNFLHCFKDHCAAVKALSWCPYDSSVLASGGGTEDRSIKLWNVCGLEWNRHHKELLSGHGFSTSAHHNQLCMWTHPSMTKVGGLDCHASRVLHLCQSPDGLTVVSVGADKTLRFSDVFGPPVNNTSEISNLDNLLSL